MKPPTYSTRGITVLVTTDLSGRMWGGWIQKEWKKKRTGYIRWLETGDEESFMDDAKLRDTTANVLSWLRCETKQLGLSYPPPLPARQSLYAHANHPLQPISFVDW